MRKIISLGLFALMLSIFSSQVFAGNHDACDELTDPDSDTWAPRLYGLCVAWHNADEKGRAAIEKNYSKRGGGTIPGSSAFRCPCWGSLADEQVGTIVIDDVLTYLPVFMCNVKSTNQYDLIIFNSPDGYQWFSAGFSKDEFGCGYRFGGTGIDPSVSDSQFLSETDVQNCRDEIQGIALLYPADC